MGDCYDGQIWKDFQMFNGQPFLPLPNNCGLLLNIDLFQPTKRGCQSIGSFNLHRHERFKPENLIIGGNIPGPKEPKHSANSFLQPLVDELIGLCDGVLLKTSDGRTEKFQAALLALSSDIPATRK